MKAAALRGALSDRARNGRVHVVDRPRRRRDARRPRPRSRRWPHVSDRAPRAGGRSSATTTVDLEEPAQRRPRAPARRRPAQHLRRAGLRRRGLHPGRARRVPRRPAHGQGAKAVATRAELETARPRSGMTRSPTRATSCSRPVISEKSYGLLDENKYTFLVAPGRQQDRRSRSRSSRSSASRSRASTRSTARASASAPGPASASARTPSARSSTVAEGDRIDIFGGPVSLTGLHDDTN